MSGFNLKSFETALMSAVHRLFANSPMLPMLDYHFSLGGKRLRPQMAFRAGEGAQAPNFQDTLLNFSIAVEFIHNATLIHDDIQDGDEFRRGKPALWKKFSMPQAINCGDALFFAAIQLVQESPCEIPLREQLQKWMTDESFAVIDGQSQEFHLKQAFMEDPSKVTKASYEKMVRGKTSALFVMPYVGGSLIARRSEAEIKKIAGLAGELGFAFQIQDDLLDLWGSKGRDRIGTDIAEGKLSYPVVLAWVGMSRENERLREIILKPRDQTSESEIKWAIKELENCGAKEKAKKDCLEILDRLVQESKQLFDLAEGLQIAVAQL